LIDTGVNVDHVDFDGRAKHGPTFVSRSEDPYDANGHGSFVAGVCCGMYTKVFVCFLLSNSNLSQQGKVHGIAKKATVISLKALDQEGSGRLSNILLALHWIVKRHIGNPGAKSIVK
jgi:cerevisin